MALTGLGLVGFLLAHLLGNLLIFKGAQAFNQYARSLRDYNELLWFARIALIGMFFLHIFSALRLTRLNRLANPTSYRKKNYRQSTFASRTMMLSGLVVLFFVLYHLAHFTFKWTHPELSQLGEFNIYPLVVGSFRSPVVSVFYILSIVLLMLHLQHGLFALFQSLGIHHTKYHAFVKGSAVAVCFLLGFGFIAIPLSVLFGII
jgi:succinate dehydrogenase / fumarate reductase cytochrome b subunit